MIDPIKVNLPTWRTRPRNFGDVLRELRGSALLVDSFGNPTEEEMRRVNSMTMPHGVRAEWDGRGLSFYPAEVDE